MDRPHGQGLASGATVLGRYEVVDRLGSGGFGVVWRAHDTLLGRDVALKRIPRDPGGSEPDGSEPGGSEPDDDDRVLREGRALARVAHPGVVAIHDMVVDDDAVWLVLEHVPGHSLDLLVARDGRRDPIEVAAWGVTLAGALAQGHADGLIHRDVKPGNVLVDDRARPAGVKLADYGIARVLGAASVTTARARHGSLPWASPEWARNEEVAAASDVFSLGATLFHAVEGHPPFADEEPGRALVLEVAAGRVLPAHHAGPLSGLLHRMLDPDPSGRPTARETAAELAVVAASHEDTGHDTAAAPAPPRVRPPSHEPRRWWPARGHGRPAVLAVLAVLAITLVAVFGAAAVAGGPWAPGSSPAEDPLALPAVGLLPVAPAADERDVDPCTVVDATALSGFGTPSATPGPYLSACTVRLTRPGSGAGSRLDVDVFRGADSTASDDRRRLGAGYVVRRPADEGCRATVTLDIDTSIALRTTTDDSAVDPCRLVDAAVALAVRGLNDHGFVVVPGRTASWPLALVDSCTLATRASLAPVGLAGQLTGPQSSGWGRWDCRWGRDVAGGPAVDLVLRLEDDGDVLGRGPLGLVAGRTVVTERADGEQNPRSCKAAVLWRPVVQPRGLFQVIEAQVDAPGDDARLCGAATGIVTTAADLLDARS